MSQIRGIPDMRFINRNVPVADVARALDLRLDEAGRIHCWHPDRHQNGDRTASVGIRKKNNTVKCFGCESNPKGPIDLVMDVLGLTAADGALWIAERFEVPTIAAHKRLTDPDRRRRRVGYERGVELLIRSGLWGTLSEATRSIAPVLLALSVNESPTAQEQTVRISYAGITRYSGVSSPTAIRKALLELSEIGFLRLPEAGRRAPGKPASSYVLTPNSGELYGLAQAFAAQMKSEIAAERELRARRRKEEIRVWKEESDREVSKM